MKIITTTRVFKNAVESTNLSLQDFRLGPGQTNTRRLSTLPEEVRSVVRAYNTEDDKFPEILRQFKSQGLALRYDAGPDLVWTEDAMYPPEGRIGVCIIFPKPQTSQNEWKIPECSNPVDEAQPKATEQKTSSDLAVTLEPVGAAGLPVISSEQKLQIEIGQAIPGGGSSSRPAAATPQLRPGDIIVLNAYEYLRVKAGGIAMVLILYRPYQHETGQ
ncbi:hypothetical protein BHE90_010083 [Fusarium euwallaceae]|uniref:Uncharacterized protein n=1 Tax=Fusarium euwallaceae TaxID=1147111 RepID=A0A430LIE3_9HYPO|nr:hypothetical protein BHE90_010083 [Fusarium euwallaceae]